MDRLKGRVALVTAGGSGMGRAGAERFAHEGAHVVVTDLDEAAAKETASLIAAAGGSAEAHRLDVADVAQINELVSVVERQHQVLHVLYNHAGIPGKAGLIMDERDFDFGVDVNLKGAFYMAGECVRLLERAEGKGSIIFTASVSGLVGSPFSPLYAMTKGGVVLMMKSMALALAPQIRVNAICPGPVDTPMLPQFFGREPGANVADLMSGFMTAVPMQRPCQPQEIAAAAAFLASDDASFVTGVALPVDGGYIAR